MTETPYRILVTGDSSDEGTRYPRQASGRSLEWTQLPVLAFERLPVPPEIVERVAKQPFGWIVFSSPRAVRFWTATLLEHGVDFPHETQVACIGERTAEAASDVGFAPDFYPTEPGTECFLVEFEDLLAQRAEKPSIFIPAAEGGRPTVRERLAELGCEVVTTPLYRTTPRADLPPELAPLDAILFTSPSSVDAFLSRFAIPDGTRVVSVGAFTGEHLLRRGIPGVRRLPQGDYGKIGEVLC